MGEGVPGKRVSLGTDSDGALAVTNEKEIASLSRRALVIGDQSLSA